MQIDKQIVCAITFSFVSWLQFFKCSFLRLTFGTPGKIMKLLSLQGTHKMQQVMAFFIYVLFSQYIKRISRNFSAKSSDKCHIYAYSLSRDVLVLENQQTMLCDFGMLTLVLSGSGEGLQSPVISIEPHSASVKPGESASFRCRVYNGAQPVRLEWKLTNNQPLPGTLLLLSDSSVLFYTNMNRELSVFFPYIQKKMSLITAEAFAELNSNNAVNDCRVHKRVNRSAEGAF